MKPTRASAPFRAADYLQADEIPGYLAEVTADGDTRALTLALREAADVLGMAELARRTGLYRETLYRTLSENGNPRLDTLHAILAAFGMRLTISKRAPAKRALRNPRTGKVKALKTKPAKQVVRKRA